MKMYKYWMKLVSIYNERQQQDLGGMPQQAEFIPIARQGLVAATCPHPTTADFFLFLAAPPIRSRERKH